MNVEELFGPIKADNDNLRVCPTCGGEVVGRASRKFCSSKCQRRDEYSRRDFVAEKASALEKVPEQICEKCGNTFKGIPKDGKPLRFCSKSCSGSAMLMQNRKVAPPKAVKFSVYRPLCGYCGARFTASIKTSRLCSNECRRLDGLAKMRAKAVANDNKPDVSCVECGERFSRVYGDKRKRFCSKECGDRAKRRIAHRADRARLRSAFVENVDPLEVFGRDGWRCQLCGIKTPRNKRGTYAPNAPELDHILPLSRGGEHSYRNTQCACRACNAAKSDTPLGQMRLFG